MKLLIAYSDRDPCVLEDIKKSYEMSGFPIPDVVIIRKEDFGNVIFDWCNSMGFKTMVLPLDPLISNEERHKILADYCDGILCLSSSSGSLDLYNKVVLLNKMAFKRK